MNDNDMIRQILVDGWKMLITRCGPSGPTGRARPCIVITAPDWSVSKACRGRTLHDALREAVAYITGLEPTHIKRSHGLFSAVPKLLQVGEIELQARGFLIGVIVQGKAADYVTGSFTTAGEAFDEAVWLVENAPA